MQVIFFITGGKDTTELNSAFVNVNLLAQWLNRFRGEFLAPDTAGCLGPSGLNRPLSTQPFDLFSSVMKGVSISAQERSLLSHRDS